MADRLHFHLGTERLDPPAAAAVREAQQALLEAAVAVEQSNESSKVA